MTHNQKYLSIKIVKYSYSHELNRLYNYLFQRFTCNKLKNELNLVKFVQF